MSNEEIKEIKENNESKCNCCELCKTCKKVLTIALGTFIGFYCATSLFFALHKPPMMHHSHKFRKPPCGMEQGFEQRGQFRGKFKGEMPFRPEQMPQNPEMNK